MNAKKLQIRPLEEALPLAQKAIDEARPEGLKICDIESDDPVIPVTMALPWRGSEDVAKKIQDTTEALIFVTHASGAHGDRFTPALSEIISSGIPVFLVSDNPGDDHGILRVQYAAGARSFQAGAIAIEKINVRDIALLKQEIYEALALGKRRNELAQHIQELFSYGENEEPPKPEWELPEGIAAVRAGTERVLRRAGMDEEEIAAYLAQWDGDKK